MTDRRTGTELPNPAACSLCHCLWLNEMADPAPLFQVGVHEFIINRCKQPFNKHFNLLHFIFLLFK